MIIFSYLNVEKEGFCYQARANVFMNTNFTITEDNYKILPTLKTVNDEDEERRERDFDIFTHDGKDPDEIQRLDSSFIMDNLK